MSNAEALTQLGIETVKVRLHQTEMLINIVRPVLQYFGEFNNELTELDRSPLLNDAALNVYYTTVDIQLEALNKKSKGNKII